MDFIRSVLEKRQPKPKMPEFRPGDTVAVNAKIVEGEKTRIQTFEGVVLRVQNAGPNSTFTVRKISNGIGVERIFPFYSPAVESVEVKARSNPKRSRLFYLRKLAGRAARLDSELEFAGAAEGSATETASKN